MKCKRLAALCVSLLLLFVSAAFGWAESTGACPDQRAAAENGGNHRYEVSHRQEPDCENSGYQVFTCVYCGASYREELAPNGHVYGGWSVQEKGDCQQRSIQSHTCAVCGKTEWTSGDFGSHQWGEWTEVPSAEGPGMRERVCALCGTVQQKALSYDVQELPQEDGLQSEEEPLEEAEAPAGETQDAPAGRLVLLTVPAYPQESYSLSLIGATDAIPYLLTVANLNEEPCAFTSFTVTVGEASQVYPVGPVTLSPGESLNFSYERQFTRADMLPGSADADSLGFVEITFSVQAGDLSGSGEFSSNAVTLRHRIASQPLRNASLSGQVVLSCRLTDGNEKNVYVPGGLIAYEITVTNRSNVPLDTLSLMNWADGTGRDASLVKTLRGIQPGEARVESLYYTVTPEDALRGCASMIPSVSWVDPGSGAVGLCSANPWVAAVETVPEESSENPLSLSIYAVNEPQNGSGFQSGEIIRFGAEVANVSDAPLYDIVLFDTLTRNAGGAPLLEIASLQPGETRALDIFYGVTALDIPSGAVCQLIYAKAGTVSGDMASASAVAVCPAAVSGAGVALNVEAVGAPANGVAYQFGENVYYQITVLNASGRDIRGLCLNASPENAPSGQVAQQDALPAGAFARFDYKHAITAEEAQTGAAVCFAFLTYEVENGETLFTAADGPVAVKAGAGLNSAEAVPGALSLIPDNTESCVKTLIGKGSNTAEYTQHYCLRHAALAQTASEWTAQPEDEEAAWNKVLALWTEEMDALYQEYLQAAAGSARMALMQERARFLAFAEAYSALNLNLNPGQPAAAARMTAQLVMDRCAEMCYALHNPGVLRPDSAAGGNYAKILTTGVMDTCMRMQLLSQNDDRQYRDILCADHSAAEEAAALMNSQRDARFLWLSALKTELSERFLTASADTQTAVLRFSAAFSHYLDALEETLNDLYPGDAQTVQEVLAQTVMNQTIALCREGR